MMLKSRLARNLLKAVNSNRRARNDDISSARNSKTTSKISQSKRSKFISTTIDINKPNNNQQVDEDCLIQSDLNPTSQVRTDNIQENETNFVAIFITMVPDITKTTTVMKAILLNIKTSILVKKVAYNLAQDRLQRIYAVKAHEYALYGVVAAISDNYSALRQQYKQFLVLIKDLDRAYTLRNQLIRLKNEIGELTEWPVEKRSNQLDHLSELPKNILPESFQFPSISKPTTEMQTDKNETSITAHALTSLVASNNASLSLNSSTNQSKLNNHGSALQNSDLSDDDEVRDNMKDMLSRLDKLSSNLEIMYSRVPEASTIGEVAKYLIEQSSIANRCIKYLANEKVFTEINKIGKDRTKEDTNGIIWIEGVLPLYKQNYVEAINGAKPGDACSILSRLIYKAFPKEWITNVRLTNKVIKSAKPLTEVLGYPQPLLEPFVGNVDESIGAIRLKALFDHAVRLSDSRKTGYDTNMLKSMRRKVTKALGDCDSDLTVKFTLKQKQKEIEPSNNQLLPQNDTGDILMELEKLSNVSQSQRNHEDSISEENLFEDYED